MCSSFCILTSRPYLGEEEYGYLKTCEHLEIVGYNIATLNTVILKLSNSQTVTESISKVWEHNGMIKEVCKSPLHMAMMVYIFEYENRLNIQTLYQLYSTSCRLLKLCGNALGTMVPHGGELCIAFQTLHEAAFKMFLTRQDTFSDNGHIQEKINRLSFVSVIPVPGTSSQIRYTFSHSTFLEFFAALHLATLPHNKQLAYISLYRRSYMFETLWYFYFGWVGDIYFHRGNTSVVEPLLGQFLMSGYEMKGGCEVMNQLDNVLHVIGWTGRLKQKLLQSVKIRDVSVSLVCLHCSKQNDCRVTVVEQDSSIFSLWCELGEDAKGYYLFKIGMENFLSQQQIRDNLVSIAHCYFDDSYCMNFTSTVVSSLHKYPIGTHHDLYLLSVMMNAFPNLKSLHLKFGKFIRVDVDLENPLYNPLYLNWDHLQHVAVMLEKPDISVMNAMLGLFKSASEKVTCLDIFLPSKDSGWQPGSQMKTSETDMALLLCKLTGLQNLYINNLRLYYIVQT